MRGYSFIDNLREPATRATGPASIDTLWEPATRATGPARSCIVLLSGVDDAHKLAHFRAFLLELHVSVLLGKQRVIATAANVSSRMKPRAALAHDDVARKNLLATVDFDA